MNANKDDFALEQYDPAKNYRLQKKFDCGNQVVNRFVAGSLKKQVRQNLSRCFVLIDTSDEDRFIAFYTLSSFAIEASNLESLSEGNFPNRIPCSRLIMLGVDTHFQGKGLGKRLMKSVLKKTLLAADHVGVLGLYLDADPNSHEFYKSLGFIALKTKSRMNTTPMFISIETLRSLS